MTMRHGTLKEHAEGLLGLLGVEFLLGVWAGLFVKFPEDSSSSQLWDFSFSQWSVFLHAILGALLVVGAISLVISAHKQQKRTWKIAGWTGLVFMLIALGSGERFVSTQNDWYTFLMSVGFVGVMAAYIWGLSVSQGEK